MIINNLKLTNFRNYNNYQIDFSPLTVFIGPNGIGKTNLLEAIYLLSTTTSYRTKNNNDLVKWDSEFSRLTSRIENQEIELVIDLIQNKKQFKISGLDKKTSEVLGCLQTVLFSPEQINIIIGSPQTKRRFLNILLSQVKHEYIDNLITLQKVLKNRNKLLFAIKVEKNQPEELLFWDKKIIELNHHIVKTRRSVVDFINQNLTDHYQKISGTKSILNIDYVPKLNPDVKLDSLEIYHQQEIKQTYSLWGPHRDEISFLLDKKEIDRFASRGELRSATLALKMAEFDYLSKKNGKAPLLLLDDVFSELDQTRRSLIVEIVNKSQSIITTTDRDFLDPILSDKAKIIDLSKSNII